MNHLVTHSGGFHADEICSSVILTRLYPQAEIVRTRDPAWIVPADGRLIYDVGGDYNAEAMIFDHHQRGAPLREDGRPYSSFGLIWKHFGMDYLRDMAVPDEHLQHVWNSLDGGFVLPIDLIDNGALSPSDAGPMLSGLTFSPLIELLKPVFDETGETAEREAFDTALIIARTFIEARVKRSAAKLRAESLAMKAVADAGESEILELPMGMPFRPAVIKAGADHLLFVVTPRSTEWTIGGIRAADEGFAQRADLPAAWAGLSGAELEAASGVIGAKFCHNGRFIAAAATREAALEMARIAVTTHKAKS